MRQQCNRSESLFYAPNLMDVVTHLEDTRRRGRYHASETNRASPTWDLNAGWDGALMLARHGWDEGLRRIQSLVSSHPTYRKNVNHYGVAGSRPDIGRYLQGNPYNMVRRVKEKHQRATITLVFNIVASCAISGESMANMGAAICVLVDRLENAGVRCELMAGAAIEMSHGHKFSAAWGIKQADQPLEMASLAFSFGHPAMLRRLVLALVERIDPEYQNDYYGTPGNLTLQRLLDCPKDALIIQGVGHNPGACSTLAGALEFAKNEINAAAQRMGSDNIAELEEVA